MPGNIDPFAFDPFNWSAAYASLPSGHATTAFSVLVAFGSLWPRARAVIWIYALVIVASRVVVTAHFPSDVLAGAVVGSVGALHGAALFRAAAAGVHDRAGRRRQAAGRAVAAAAQSRCPRPFRPLEKAA